MGEEEVRAGEESPFRKSRESPSGCISDASDSRPPAAGHFASPLRFFHMTHSHPLSHSLSTGWLLMQLWAEGWVDGGGGWAGEGVCLVLPVLALQAALNKVFTRPRGAQL